MSMVAFERSLFKANLRYREGSSGIYQYLPDATMSDVRGGQTGLKVLENNLFKPPTFPQVAIKFILTMLVITEQKSTDGYLLSHA